eukprot:TRINITY_DN2417_c0_g1_i1.p1 TRINITY_DN2417_c0_g1~~TRINITY_DN2417_c0_g1_i1.p1  ORF type:complete len:737 (+),score=150.13 TRINITY_DN2417_c0_g1_i1:61-2271(+)
MEGGSVTGTMRAWLCEGYNASAPLAELWHRETVPVPDPGEGVVLVKVHYAAVDPLDSMILSGVYRERFPIKSFPFVPGFDVAGEVVKLGTGCNKFQVGDRVVLCLGIQESCQKDANFGPAGAFAEYCACPEVQISKIPQDLTLSKVAGLPLAGLSAYQALFTGCGSSTKGEPLGNITENSKVLVLGGNKGPGHLAIQMARLKGATVTTTVPPSCIDWMVSLGANSVINFRETDWVDKCGGADFDLIFDCVGWATSLEEMAKAAETLRPGGQYISLSNWDAFDILKVSSELCGGFFRAMVPRVGSADLDLLLSWIAEGKLEVFADQICPMADLQHALRESLAGQCCGKVLICQDGASISTTRPIRKQLMTRDSMKAWICRFYTPYGAHAARFLKCMDICPVPSPSPGQVLVQVHYAAVDPMDWKMLAGVYRDRFPIRSFPFVPGFDVAGEVVALGPGCCKFQVGDHVLLCLGIQESSQKGANFGPAGALAEYCVCPEGQVSKLPQDLPLLKFAGLPLAGLAAYQALFTGCGSSTKGEPLGSITENSKVLVLGGNKGPGHLAVQMARMKGANVTTTVPPSCIDWMESLGANAVINFREQDWAESLRGADFDLVLDCVGWATSLEEMAKAAEALRPGGQYISLSNWEAFEFLKASSGLCSRVFRAMVPKADSKDMDCLIGWVATGALQVTVDQVCPFKEVRHALHESVVGNCRGKVVICQCNATGTRASDRCSGAHGGA